MNRDMQVGLALAILLIGIVGALCLRDEAGHDQQSLPGSTEEHDSPDRPTTPRPQLDSRSETERPPTPAFPPRRATREVPPLTTGEAPSDIPATTSSVQQEKPTPTRTSPSVADRTAANPNAGHPPVRDLAPASPVAIPLMPPTPPPPALPVQKTFDAPPVHRQSGSPPRTVRGDVDRSPIIFRFRPARHPFKVPPTISPRK